MLDYVHKFVNQLLEMYPLTTFVVEKLDKQLMLEGASDSLSKKISRTVWRSIHHVLNTRHYFTVLLLKKLTHTSHLGPAPDVSRKVGRTFRCGFALDLKMCGFTHILTDVGLGYPAKGYERVYPGLKPKG